MNYKISLNKEFPQVLFLMSFLHLMDGFWISKHVFVNKKEEGVNEVR